MKKIFYTCLLILSSLSVEAASYIYQSGPDNPWSNTTNDSAMNSAFGPSNWQRGNSYNISQILVSSAAFLDGSDSNANELSSFLNSNRSTLESWVNNGGHLFINSAPNEGSSFSLLFGATLNYPGFSGSALVTALGVAEGLTGGGITTGYVGSAFSHASITGLGLNTLITGTSGTILASMQQGAGFVMFGGQTTTNFHSPNADANRLLVNELTLMARGAQGAQSVPEPATIALMGLGFAGMAARRRKSL